LPEPLADEQFYQPVNRGLEQKIADKMTYLRHLDAASDTRRYRSD
jgi:putative ATPase